MNPCGSSRKGLVYEIGRDYIGIELSEQDAQYSRQRLGETLPLFTRS